MTRTALYLVAMFSVVLLDIFDKLEARYGCRLQEGCMLPDRPIAFGLIENVRTFSGRRSLRFLTVKIPFVKTWGIVSLWRCPEPEYGFRSHTLLWIEGHEKNISGWRIIPPFEG